jgi:hypothetical protein
MKKSKGYWIEILLAAIISTSYWTIAKKSPSLLGCIVIFIIAGLVGSLVDWKRQAKKNDLSRND